jgi:DNA modification methylase
MPAKPSALLDTRVIYCDDNLDQLGKLPEACVDLIYIDPPFNSNRNYEVWGPRRSAASKTATLPRKSTSISRPQSQRPPFLPSTLQTRQLH